MIKKLESLKPSRGAATHLLTMLKDIALRFDIFITGNPVIYPATSGLPADLQLTQERLEQWYLKHGFKLRVDSMGFPHIWFPEFPNM